MLFNYEFKEKEYFWANFLFDASRDVERVLLNAHLCFAENGMKYRFHKGNDSHLNYTLIDMKSGMKWMLDHYEDIKNNGGRAKRYNEYIVASYDAGFNTTCTNNNFQRQEVFCIERGEILLFLIFNGKIINGSKDTFTLTFFFDKEEIFNSGVEENNRKNFFKIINFAKKMWLKISPDFSWMDVSSWLDFSAAEQILRGKLPLVSWFFILPRKIVDIQIYKLLGSIKNISFDSLEDGSILIENLKCRKGKLGYF